MGADVLVRGKLGKGALQLLLGEIQCVVVDVFGGILECLQKEVYFPKVAGTKYKSVSQSVSHFIDLVQTQNRRSH